MLRVIWKGIVFAFSLLSEYLVSYIIFLLYSFASSATRIFMATPCIVHGLCDIPSMDHENRRQGIGQDVHSHALSARQC